MSDFVKSRLNMKRRILIVDDEEINRMLLKNILSNDYEVLLAENGKEALEIARSEKERLTAILLDLRMPVMDGYEFFGLLKQDEVLKQIPVIVLTSDKEAEVKSLNMGVADFIPKPYDVPEVILARIGRIVQLYEDRNIITATQFDSVTELFTREYFLEYETIVDQYYPEDDKDMIAVNVNRFHVINATHGRELGNKVLSTIGKCIKDYVRNYHGIAGRFDADNFYIYIKDGDHAERLYEAICASLKDVLEDTDCRIRLGVYKNASENPDLARRHDYAYLACNSIKGNYTEHVAYYDDEISKREHYEEKLIHDLDKALAEKQFKVFFQPKYKIQSGEPELGSAEALIRWVHPELGMISPGVFIPLFEDNGLISKVDYYVWKDAAEHVAKWRKEYGVNIPVSVNVSRMDMLSENLADEFVSIVDAAGIDVQSLLLEITESAYTDDKTNIIAIVKELREKGFRIEMDDFGTGYSSLNMLTDLPFDVLKLDMVFVRNIHSDERALKLVEFIMEIAKYLNVTVVAEGVELKEQYEQLKLLGCDVIQGYYFSKPLCADDFEELLRKEINHDN